MKKYISLILVFVMALTMTACNSKTETKNKEQEITSENSNASYFEQAKDFQIEYTKGASGYIAVATWTNNDIPYELCLTGVPSDINESVLEAIINNFYSGDTLKYTDETLVDAEKCSNKLYGALGNWAYEDENRQGDDWGDSNLCWAASASDMLTLSGWKSKARDVNGNEIFETEDDLFQMYVENFPNDGAYQSDAIEYFFTGKCSGEAYPTEDVGTAYIVDTDYSEYTYFYDYNSDSANSSSIEDITSVLQRLKDGSAIGACVTLNEYQYELNSEPDTLVTWSADKNAFIADTSFSIGEDKSNLTWSAYTFDSAGNYIFLDKKGDAYVDSSGTAYDSICVLRGYFYTKENGDMAPVTKTWGDYWVEDYVSYNPNELDIDNPIVSTLLGNGQHAVTITGYIMNLSDTGSVEALFIADSDNDGSIYQLTDDNIDRKTRCNSYTMYPVTPCAATDGDTIELTGYADNCLTLLANLTILNPLK